MKTSALLPMLALALSLCIAPAALAGGGGGGGGGRNFGGRNFGGGRNFNIRQMAVGRLQQSVGFTDQEWTVVEPKLWRVAELQLALGQGPMARITTMLQRFGNRGNQNQNGADPMAQLYSQEDAPVAQMTQQYQQIGNDLKTLVNDQGSSDQQLETKLTELRDERKTIQESLATAQKDLQSVLTLRQESLLVLDGYLD